MTSPPPMTPLHRFSAAALRAGRQAVVRVRATLRSERALYFVLFIVIGVVGGLVGSGVRWLGVGVRALFFSSSSPVLDAVRQLPWQTRLLAPAAGALFAGLIIHYLLRGVGGGGVAEIMEAVAMRQRSLGLRASLLKSFGSTIMMATGGSVGREGPSAALSAAISTKIAHALHLTPARRNILIGCGVAAGMAAVYNAPLGASLFVMEVVIANFAMDVFGPLVVASVVSTLVSRLLFAAGPLYDVPAFAPSGVSEFFLLALLGIPCAAMGNLFTSSLQRLTDLFRSIRVHPVLKVTGGGLLLGIIGLWLPHIMGNGYAAVAATLNDRFPIELLAAIVIGKMLATGISLGSGGLGGAMTPTLLVGAAFGGLIGHGLQLLGPGLATQPGSYALVAMAGVLAATTHAPIMATFLVFELSQEYSMILPLGVCAGVSALLARRWKETSIYTERLSRKGLDLDATIEETAIQAIRVEDVMWKAPPTLLPGTALPQVMKRFLDSRRHLMHVVGPNRTYYGLIAVQDLYPHSDDEDLNRLIVAMDLARNVPAVSPDSPVSSIMEKFWFQEYGELPVLVGADPPRFAGIVTRRDILGAFDREVLRRKILTARYKVDHQPGQAPLPLVGDYAIEEIPIPRRLLGKTLAEVALPQRFRLTAVALKTGPAGSGEEIIPPPLDRPFEETDRLVLMGRRSDINDFARHLTTENLDEEGEKG